MSGDLSFSHRLVEIECRLEIHPKLGGCAQHTCQIQSGVRRNIALALNQLVQSRPRPAELLRQRRLRHLSGDKELFEQHLAGMKWVFRESHGTLLQISGASMIINYLNLVGIAVMPTKDHSPLIVDPNRVKPLPLAFQRLQSITRWLTQVADLRSIVQVEQLAPGRSYQIWWKSKNGFRSPIVEKVFGKSIDKGFNHVTMLSDLDNHPQEGQDTSRAFQDIAWNQSCFLSLLGGRGQG